MALQTNQFSYHYSASDMRQLFPAFDSGRIDALMGFFLNRSRKQSEFSLESELVGVSRDGRLYYRNPESFDLSSVPRADIVSYMNERRDAAGSTGAYLVEFGLDKAVLGDEVKTPVVNVLQDLSSRYGRMAGHVESFGAVAEEGFNLGKPNGGANYTFKLDELIAIAPNMTSEDFQMYVALTMPKESNPNLSTRTEVVAVTKDRYVIYANDVQGNKNIALYMAPEGEFLRRFEDYIRDWQGIINIKEGPERISIKDLVSGDAVKNAKDNVERFGQTIARAKELLETLQKHEETIQAT
jgi:hypothetical protein